MADGHLLGYILLIGLAVLSKRKRVTTRFLPVNDGRRSFVAQFGFGQCLMNMRVSRVRFIAAWLPLCLLGCNGIHFRPGNVPSSAEWADNTFIDCSVVPRSRANHCTVYKDDSGEILADGLFRLNRVYAPAEKSELRYAAFGNGMIYLQDARILVQCTAADRDPSHRLVNDRLKALAGSPPKAIDCNEEHSSGETDDVAACAIRAFAERKAFYVHYYEQDPDSFSFTGFAGDTVGKVYEMHYTNRRLVVTGVLSKEEQFLDDYHTLVLPCPTPVTLERSGKGRLTCARPVG